MTVTEKEGENGLSQLYFAVKDHGIGVNEEDRQRIFGSFEQAEHSGAGQQGTGLGLAISNRLVHMMGGSRDFAFKIKSSPFCKGSIWQNGEFSY